MGKSNFKDLQVSCSYSFTYSPPIGLKKLGKCGIARPVERITEDVVNRWVFSPDAWLIVKQQTVSLQTIFDIYSVSMTSTKFETGMNLTIFISVFFTYNSRSFL
jgi:hypothetical protein